MAEIKIVEEAIEVYYMSTYQGKMEVNGKVYTYRYSEDSNGATLYILTDQGWEESDFSNPDHSIVYTACNYQGNPTDLGSVGDVIEIDDDEIDDWS